MPVITCIDDLKRLHKRRTPKMFYDYCESGSYTEQTFRENTSDFQRLRLRQKVAVDMLKKCPLNLSRQKWNYLPNKPRK